MPDPANPLKRKVPSRSALTTRTIPSFRGFPDKLKKIDPELQAVEDNIRDIFRALEEKLNAAINAQRADS
jgi:hypothetical protein